MKTAMEQPYKITIAAIVLILSSILLFYETLYYTHNTFIIRNRIFLIAVAVASVIGWLLKLKISLKIFPKYSRRFLQALIYFFLTSLFAWGIYYFNFKFKSEICTPVQTKIITAWSNNIGHSMLNINYQNQYWTLECEDELIIFNIPSEMSMNVCKGLFGIEVATEIHTIKSVPTLKDL